ncbi:VWA domain-containing protein [Viridibacillus sp. NPDC093762]|uniref:vWA domain-containing protein n=1 Tax=Viridibacillus sp. NPDC093762 TaxID=3390720 RepID=UPI003D0166FA
MVVKRRKQIKNNSVLNTDSYDRRKYNSLREKSDELKIIEKKASMSNFDALMGDIWASLFKTSPELCDKASKGLEGNRAMIDRIMSDEFYEKIRPSTKLDSLMSALSSIRFSEKVSDWIKEEQKTNEELKEKMEKLQEEQQSKGKGKAERVRNAEQALQQALEDAVNQNGEGIASAFQKACDEATEQKKKVEDLFGYNAGNGKPQLANVPFEEQIKLAELIKRKPNLKKIADWAGRFKVIARKKQKSKHKESLSRNGITVGNDIENMLPAELLMYSSKLTRLDFLRRYAEQQTLMYDRKGKEQLGKGPIVVCLDESGSMKKMKEISKGFTLALMMVAKMQKRDFAIVPFSSVAYSTEYPKGKISSVELGKFASSFIDGGTEFKKPLNLVQSIISKSTYSKADIIFITDGSASLDEYTVENFNAFKEKKEARMLSLIIGENENDMALKKVSDKVVKITNFTDDAAFEAFEI